MKFHLKSQEAAKASCVLKVELFFGIQILMFCIFWRTGIISKTIFALNLPILFLDYKLSLIFFCNVMTDVYSLLFGRGDLCWSFASFLFYCPSIFVGCNPYWGVFYFFICHNVDLQNYFSNVPKSKLNSTNTHELITLPLYVGVLLYYIPIYRYC